MLLLRQIVKTDCIGITSFINQINISTHMYVFVLMALVMTHIDITQYRTVC